MKPTFQPQSVLNGLCCIIASVLISGCATSAAQQNVSYQDLNYFVINCSMKEEQIRFLNSQRLTKDQKLMARFQAAFIPFAKFLTPDAHARNFSGGWGQNDRMINQILRELDNNCGTTK